MIIENRKLKIKNKRYNFRLKIFIFTSLLSTFYFLLLTLLASCSFFPEAEISKSVMLMDSLIEINAYGGDLEPALHEALEAGEHLSTVLNRYNAQSEIAKINRLAGVSAVKIELEIIKLIQRTNQISQDLEGTFDITIGPLIDVWKQKGAVVYKRPSVEQINKTKKLVDFNKIEIDEEKQMIGLKEKDMSLDLGGVAKGYLLDKMRSILIEHKVKGALIDARSNIVAIGKPKNKESWRVGIQHPRQEGEIIGIVTLKPGQALSTSGDYERFFKIGDKRYSHIIDPRSGYPSGLCQSVTIVGQSAFECDILSTAVFVMGPIEGMKFIEAHKNLSGLIVDSLGNILTSSRIKFESASD